MENDIDEVEYVELLNKGFTVEEIEKERIIRRDNYINNRMIDLLTRGQ